MGTATAIFELPVSRNGIEAQFFGFDDPVEVDPSLDARIEVKKAMGVIDNVRQKCLGASVVPGIRLHVSSEFASCVKEQVGATTGTKQKTAVILGGDVGISNFEEGIPNQVITLPETLSQLGSKFVRKADSIRRSGSVNENIIEVKEFQIGEKTYRSTIEELGQTELLSRIVQDWLLNPDSPKVRRLPSFKERQREGSGKRLNERQFLERYYGKFLSAGALYRDELRKLDSSLVNHLDRYFTENEFNELLPKKSVRIDRKLNALAAVGQGRSELNNLVQAAFRRRS